MFCVLVFVLCVDDAHVLDGWGTSGAKGVVVGVGFDVHVLGEFALFGCFVDPFGEVLGVVLEVGIDGVGGGRVGVSGVGVGGFGVGGTVL